jgi:hypothetical protein
VAIGVYAAPAQPDITRPGMADVFGYACAQIHRSAAEIWPGVPVVLECHVPSVTGYVHRVRVGDCVRYAKISILGVSLVSLLRGACGPWPAVLRAQEAYVTKPDGLLAREAAQLRVLADLDRPRVCAVAGSSQGVIFTEPVTGPTLGELLLARPAGPPVHRARPAAPARRSAPPGPGRRHRRAIHQRDLPAEVQRLVRCHLRGAARGGAVRGRVASGDD